jgi:hypothetical protein
MYCPTCGSEERQLSQFCRSCGTDLRSVRNSLEKLDLVTASAVTARDRISSAIADKIREAQSASELHKVAEDVLPEIEKFLESPEERRLRRIRAGVVTAFIGIGAILGGMIASINDRDLLVMTIPGAVALFIGVAMILNGLLFTVMRKRLPERQEIDRDLTGAAYPAAVLHAADFTDLSHVSSSDPGLSAASVTEHTTKHLINNK